MTNDELARFRAGDERLFAALVGEHTPRLLAVARRLAPLSPDDAEDAVQDTWARAFQRRAEFRGEGSGGGSLGGWLLAICRSVCLDLRRRAATRPLAGAVRLDPDGADMPGTPSVGALSDVADASDGERLMAAVLELAPRQRDVVLLRIVEGRSTRESAAVLGCAEGTVKATLHHALGALRARLRASNAPAGTNVGAHSQARQL